MNEDWLTPREGFRRMGLARLLLNVVYAAALLMVAVVVIFALGLTNVR